MNITITKIVFLALTLILIPSTTAAKGSHTDKGYRGDKEHHEGKGHREDDENRGEKRHHEVKKYHEDKVDDEDRPEHGRRFFNKLRLQNSGCKDVDGRKARGLCYAFCEVLKCDRPTNSERNFCQRLYRNYERITDGGTPPCVSVTAASCPCFGDLTEAGFTENTDCSGVNDGLIKDTSSGTVLTVQAVAIVDFNACIGVDGQLQTISLDAANGCVNMIEGFCALP